MRFNDSVCIVTGGGSGIGRAACERFAAEGARVVIADVNEKGGNETVETITSAGGEALFIKTDVSQSTQVQEMIRRTVDRWEKVNVLVNDAAIMTFKPIVDLADEDWDHVLAVNLRAIFLTCKYAIPHMPRGGAIVNISSVHAHETTVNVLPYATSKGGMEAFTRGLSRECQDRGIRVNSVAPGAVDTPMLWENPNIRSGEETIQGAIGKPGDIAAAICFIASGDAGYINGTTLVVDGGRLDIL